MSVNRQYKNSVFTLLFSEVNTLRELYSALKGVLLPPDVPITIDTLEDALFMDRINDISFEIGERLVVLLEHQSTINPNMPLRLLLYIAKIYEKILNRRNRESIYTKTLLKIPRPEFIVLYNGTEPYPDEQTLNLSGAFEGLFDIPPALELSVTVLNINRGHNEPVIKRSGTLDGYSAFIAKVREYEQPGRELTAAVTAAVRYCTEHDILRDFFNLHSSEVINMLVTEWNWDTFVAVRESEGEAKGRVEGKAEGRVEGKVEGWVESKAEDIKNLLDYGMTIEQAAKALKLPVDEVLQYRDSPPSMEA
jgi:hypothetical protein